MVAECREKIKNNKPKEVRKQETVDLSSLLNEMSNDPGTPKAASTPKKQKWVKIKLVAQDKISITADDFD